MPAHSGYCKCTQWHVLVHLNCPLSELSPRVCDCEYCQAHPSALISAPDMQIELHGNATNLTIDQNGDQLATFYCCKNCNDLLAVGCVIGGELRGAVNAWLLDDKDSLGVSVAIQPRLLSSEKKRERWGQLWGYLKGV